jgi:hypothetical protein
MIQFYLIFISISIIILYCYYHYDIMLQILSDASRKFAYYSRSWRLNRCM